MTRLLLAALAACVLGTAWADEKSGNGPAGGTPEAGERKAAADGRGDRRDGGTRPPKETARGETKPEKQKPCEVVRPCPID